MISLLLYVWGFWPWGTWDLSSPSRDWTCTLCPGRQSPNHWETSEVPWDNCRWRLKSKRKEGQREIGGPRNEVQNSRGGMPPGSAFVQVQEGVNILKILEGGGKCFRCCSWGRVCISASLPFMVEFTGCWARREAAGALVTAKLRVCVPRRRQRRRQRLMFKELRKPVHAGVRGVMRGEECGTGLERQEWSELRVGVKISLHHGVCYLWIEIDPNSIYKTFWKFAFCVQCCLLIEVWQASESGQNWLWEKCQIKWQKP